MTCRLRPGTVLGLAFWISLSGCAAEAAYVQVEYAPSGIYGSPYRIYDGRRVYLVDGRWYYQRGPTWVYFHREPEPLRRYRIDHYRAPRARPRASQHYVAPPARRYVAPPARSSRDRSEHRYSAPPAR